MGNDWPTKPPIVEDARSGKPFAPGDCPENGLCGELRPLPWPPQDQEIAAALHMAWHDGNWGRYHGEYTSRFAELLAEYHRVPYVYLCSSGTCAVELALRGLGVRPGDEVLLAGYDFPGNFRAIEAVGARPVLVDVTANGWTVDLGPLERAVASGTVRAVIVSHLHGELVPMADICRMAAAYGVHVVEDACQATGAWVGGRRAGTWGTAGVLSFGGSKLLTAGRGGAVLTGNPDVYQRIKIYAERGNAAYPLSELQAAVLIPQLRQLDARNEQRRMQASAWRHVFHHRLGWHGAQWAAEDRPAFYKLGFLLPTGTDRDRIVQIAEQAGFPWGRGFRSFVHRSEQRCRHAGSLAHCLQASQRTIVIDHTHLAANPEAVLESLCARLAP